MNLLIYLFFEFLSLSHQVPNFLSHFYFLFFIFSLLVGTVQIPRHDFVSTSAAILFLSDFLDPYDGDFYLDPLNFLNCQHNCTTGLTKDDVVDDIFSSTIKEEIDPNKENFKIEEKLREKDKNSIILYHNNNGTVSADFSANSSLKEHSSNSRDSSSEEHSRGLKNGDVKVNQQKCRFRDIDNDSLNIGHINDDHDGSKSNDSDKNKNKDQRNGINQGDKEPSYITTLTENILRNKNKKLNQDKKFHRKYLQLPITCCTKMTNKCKDFSLDSSYKSLLNTIQIYGDRLRSLFFKNLVAHTINDNINKAGREDDNENKNDRKTKFSIETANICLKKFINSMDKKEKYFVDKLLTLMHSHNLGLCKFPHSETTGWCEK